MNLDAIESRQPNLPRTLRDTDQPKLNPVSTSWQGSSNGGPNHPPQTTVGQLSYHRASSVAAPPVPNADGPGHRPPPMHHGPIQRMGSLSGPAGRYRVRQAAGKLPSIEKKQSTITRTYRLPFGVVTDMSNRSIATRSHWWPTSTCPMGPRRGQGDFRARQTIHDAKNEHPDATPANRLCPVDGKPFGKCPNGRQKVNHEIRESYLDAPGLVP